MRALRCAAFAVLAVLPAAVPLWSGAGGDRPEREAVAQLWAPVTPEGRASAEALTACLFVRGMQGEFDGWVGWVEPILDGEGDGTHVLHLWDSQMGLNQGPTNFDVAFFADLGEPCGGAAGPVELARFAGEGNEVGVIPAGARFAIVTSTNTLFVPFVADIYDGDACGGDPPCES